MLINSNWKKKVKSYHSQSYSESNDLFSLVVRSVSSAALTRNSFNLSKSFELICMKCKPEVR